MECYLRETELTTEYTQYTVFSQSEEERGIAVFAGSGDLTPAPLLATKGAGGERSDVWEEVSPFFRKDAVHAVAS
jgi:hypothetical protein